MTPPPKFLTENHSNVIYVVVAVQFNASVCGYIESKVIIIVIIVKTNRTLKAGGATLMSALVGGGLYP